MLFQSYFLLNRHMMCYLSIFLLAKFIIIIEFIIKISS